MLRKVLRTMSIVVLMMVYHQNVLAGPVPAAVISGEFKTIDSGVVEVLIQDNYDGDSTVSLTATIRKGKFRLRVPQLEELSTFYFYVNDNLFPRRTSFWIGKGDRIHIDVDRDSSMRFSGKGSEKCRISYEIKKRIDAIKITADRDHAENIEKYFIQRTSVISEVLEKYKPHLTRFEYNIIKAGEFGSSEWWLFTAMTDILARAEKNKHVNIDSLVKNIEALRDRRLKVTNDMSIIPGDSIATAGEYIRYLGMTRALNTQILQIRENKADPEGIWRSYKDMLSEYSGMIGEQIIAHYFSASFVGLDVFTEEEYKVLVRCIDDFMQSSKSEKVKNIVRLKYEGIKALGPGVSAYNFCLRDTAGKKWCLSDLKGKVVVLDFWFTGCKPCAQLSLEMSKIIEDFKSNDSVLFVSISSTYDRDLWIRGMGKGKGKFNGGEGLQLQIPKDSTDRILKAYAVNGFPALRLIDKDGKIFISTVPLPGPRTDEFLEKLRNALAKPRSN